MAWQSIIRRGFWAYLGVLLATTSVQVCAQTALPAALPEELLPELRPLLDAALKQSPSMLTQNLNVAAAEANAIGDRAGLYPSVSGYAQYVETQEAISAPTHSTSTTNGPVYGLNFSQPIFQWGALKAQADFGKLRVSIAQGQYAEAYRTLALTVRSQFLTLIEKKIVLRNAGNSKNAASDTLALQESRLRDGRISEGEIAEPRLLVQEAQISFDKAVEDYESSRRILARLVGLEELSDDKIPDSIPRPTFAPETARSFFEQTKRDGLANSVLLQTYKDNIAEDELTYKIQRVRLYPKFNVFANYILENETSVDSNSRKPLLQAITVTTIGGGANWSIFDGFATRGAKRSALAAKRLAELQLKDYTATTGETLRSLEKQIGFQGRLMDLTETRRSLAHAAVEKVGNDVKSGVSPQNLLNSVSGIDDAATLTAVTARADFLIRWSEFLSLAGVDPVLNNLPANYYHHAK